jgi:hypothetical protein
VNEDEPNTWSGAASVDTGSNPTPQNQMRFTYDWGDSSPDVVGIGLINPPAHTYNTAGTYIQRLTVNDMHPTNPLEDFDDDTVVVGQGAPPGDTLCGPASDGSGCADYTSEGGTGVAGDGSYRLGGAAWAGFCIRGNFCNPSDTGCGETSFQRLTTGPAGEFKCGNKGEGNINAETTCRHARGSALQFASSNWLRWDMDIKFDPAWIDQSQFNPTPPIDTGGGKHMWKCGKAPNNCNYTQGSQAVCSQPACFRFDWNPVGNAPNGGWSAKDGLGCQMYCVALGGGRITPSSGDWFGGFPSALKQNGAFSQANTWYHIKMEHRYEPSVGRFTVKVTYPNGQVITGIWGPDSRAINMPYKVGSSMGWGNFDMNASLPSSTWGYMWMKNWTITRLD